MELVCTRHCLTKENVPYVIGGRYKYYDSDYVFDSLNNKVYDIFSEVNGEDIQMGNGSMQFIKDNFFIKGELLFTKLICAGTCIGANGRKYVKNKEYYFTLKEMPYGKDELKQYVMYDSDKKWLGYVKYKFIRSNFTEWDEYVNEFLEVDELFEKLMAV
jgi:hypothetical protein